MLSHGSRQLEVELGPNALSAWAGGLKLSQAGAQCRVYTSRALKKIEVGLKVPSPLPFVFKATARETYNRFRRLEI
ncbi:LysR family cyn operon transcriptional activator [Pseudomonas baetica]|nr:LysR family cyn operon transcriptional activator [Pseudomonas baetica]